MTFGRRRRRPSEDMQRIDDSDVYGMVDSMAKVVAVLVKSSPPPVRQRILEIIDHQEDDASA